MMCRCFEFRMWTLSLSLPIRLICLLLFLSGCNDGKTPAGGGTAGTAATTGGGAGSTSEQTQELTETEESLKTILDMLKLDALGFTSPEESVVGLVNQWQLSLNTKDYQQEEPLDSKALTALQGWISKDQLVQVRRTAFNKQDIERIRDLLLMNAAVQNAANTSKTDLERAESLFRNLVRNTDLIEKRREDLPLSPFNLSLLGKVTVSERAWLYTEFLRQLKIDSVILTAASTQNASAGEAPRWDASQPFLIGVLLNKQVFLFDPTLGLPLTVPDSAGKTTATLAQTQADPKILQQYDIEQGKPYPITAGMLKSPRVLVSGDASVWSYRFKRLQVAFTGERSTVISDSLLDHENQLGLVSRVTNWHGKPWKSDQIGVWTFPSEQLAAQSELTATQKTVFTQLIDPLKMPARAEIVKTAAKPGIPEKEEEVRIPTNQFMLARIEHVRGRLNDAVKGYTLTLNRLQNPSFRERPSERTRVAYVKATEDTRYWTAVCKLDQRTPNDSRIAADRLIVYLRTYPQGEWSEACHVLLAHVLAESGDYASAIEEISKVTPENLQYAGYMFQKTQWMQASKMKASKEEATK